ncbi:MAG: hypothetical protein AB4290_08405 [Spirulina sp.]
MTYRITNKCIACDSRCQTAEVALRDRGMSAKRLSVTPCQSNCPTGAIQRENGQMTVNQSLCNGCADFYSVPQCAAICPVAGACIPHTEENLYWDEWFATYNRLQTRLQNKTQAYWHQWFDFYAQELRTLVFDN